MRSKIIQSLLCLIMLSCNNENISEFHKILTDKENTWVFMPLRTTDINNVEFNSKYKFNQDFTYDDVGILKNTHLGNGNWKYDKTKNEIFLNSQFYKISFFSNDSIVLDNDFEKAILLNTKILKKISYHRK